jgi:hypothetical protein
MVKKQTKASRLQSAKEKKLEQVPHDIEAKDDYVDLVADDTTHDLHTGLHASPDSKEKQPDPLVYFFESTRSAG